MNEYTVHAQWDAAGRVWVATSCTVPGIAVEAATCEEIIEVVQDALPDLLLRNSLESRGSTVSVVFDTRVETIRLAAA